MREKLKEIAAKLKMELRFYQCLLRHPQTPLIAKTCLWLAIGYLLLPFDLIPDFLPIIGQLDELVIIPLLVLCAIKLTPKTVIDACRTEAKTDTI